MALCPDLCSHKLRNERLLFHILLQETALSVFYPRQEMLQLAHTTVGYVKMQMVVAHGGRCAERLMYGDNVSDGGQDDLARISSVRIFPFQSSSVALLILSLCTKALSGAFASLSTHMECRRKRFVQQK